MDKICKYCGKKIKFIREGCSFFAWEIDIDKQHICKEYQELFGYEILDGIKKIKTSPSPESN